MPYKPLHEFLPANPVPKDFDTWNIIKKKLESSHSEIVCNPREIWWCSLGLNIGQEQDGKHEYFERPVLIIKIVSKTTCLCVPLTTSKQYSFFRVSIPSFSAESQIIISQVRIISIKRLLRRTETLISRKDFRMVKESLHKMIG